MIERYNRIVNDYIIPLLVFVVFFGLGTLGVLKALEILGASSVCL